MATHKSALKRLRQSEKRNLRNRSTRSACRTAVKSTRNSITEAIFALDHDDSEKAKASLEAAKQSLALAEQRIASAVAKGIYHKKSGSRRISRIAKLVAGVSARV